MRIGLVLAAVLALGAAVVATPHVAGQSAPTVGIDMEITGNDDSTVGAIQDCAELSQVGDTLTFDLVVQGIGSAEKIAGYQIDIDYDPSVIQINSVIDVDAAGSDPPSNVTIISRIDSSGGIGFFNFTEPVPDTDGSFTVAVADGTADPPFPGNHEDGDGVLARITIEAVGTGVSFLTIAGPAGGADGFPDLIVNDGDGANNLPGDAIPVGNVLNAAVSVDTTCTPPAPITAPDSQAPLPGAPAAGETPQPGTAGAAETPQPGTTGAAETPQPGTAGAAGTPQPGTPGADTQADGPPGSGVGAQTPGTPVLGGTPVSEDEGGAGGDAPGAAESDGGGLSAGAWAGIGAGIAAAAVAAAGAGWFALRRRRASGTPTTGSESDSE